MLKIIITLLCVLVLGGCSRFGVYEPDIQQGNVVNQAMINQLHIGMDKFTVQQIMGNPILTNTFADNRINYVYTFKPGKGKTTENYVTLAFKNGRLVDVKKDVANKIEK